MLRCVTRSPRLVFPFSPRGLLAFAPRRSGETARSRLTSAACVVAVAGFALSVHGVHAQPAPAPPPGGSDGSEAETPNPDDPNRRAAGDAEYLRWRAEQDRLAADRQQEELKRLRPLVDQMRETADRNALELLIEQITHSPSLDQAARDELLGPLFDRQVLLLCTEALAALSNQELERGRHMVISASHIHKQRVGTPPSHITGTLAQAQARYAGAAAAAAAAAAASGATESASLLLERARAMLLIMVEPGGPAAAQAESEVANVEKQVAQKQAESTLAKAQAAEKERKLRLALFLYESAERQGADVGDATARIRSHKRSPGLEAGMSFVVPGLGQLTHGEPVKGGMFLVGTTAAAVGGILLNSAAESTYEEYKDATDPNDASDLHSTVRWQWRGAIGLLGVAAILHVWNIYDAYTDAKTFNRTHFQ